ncbi:MAG: sensor histidine kinase, partial [Marinirhabdus sp.]|nr:sensor histidine kinase [Marinirhabdus sp.]
GVHYDLQKVPDLPLKYYKEAANIYRTIPHDFSQQHAQDLTFNIASYYIERNDVSNAKKHMELVNAEHIRKKDAVDKKLIYGVYYQIHKQSQNVDSALFYLEKRKVLEDSLALAERTNTINEFEAKYRASEKEKENLLLQSDINERKRQQRNTIRIAVAAILVGTVISFLLYKNTKRKQRIAEQARELEIRKTEKLLKEQELTTIDAMIRGQEKERQRLASDLHDSAGATLAAAKLQFDHLAKHKGKLSNSDELFQKTGQLLDEAYSEIRNMAHLKNSGVIAKNGLLPAVQKLARNASGANGLQVIVEDFGLDERLDNALEISIFRIIQELVTNIIKHAQASEASIVINQYDDSINIIIEDNGRGFEVRSFASTDGMGLSSIERRIEQLEGTLEIDSTVGKGTHVLIDIPL